MLIGKASQRRQNLTLKSGQVWGKEGMEEDIPGVGPAGAEIMVCLRASRKEHFDWASWFYWTREAPLGREGMSRECIQGCAKGGRAVERRRASSWQGETGCAWA